MKKKLYWLFAVLLITGLLLAACQPAATEAPEEVEEPAEEVVAEEPTEEEGPAPGQEDKWCSGTDIVFFPGGAPGGPFETVVFNGATAAANDLGPNMEVVWSDWNPEQMITQFSEAMATNPDGIAVMGHPGDEAFAPLVDEAVANGSAGLEVRLLDGGINDPLTALTVRLETQISANFLAMAP